MMGQYTYEGPYILCEERAQISRYSADHGVAFPDVLHTEADEGQLQHTKLCLLSSKTNRMVLKWFEALVQQYSS